MTLLNKKLGLATLIFTIIFCLIQPANAENNKKNKVYRSDVACGKFQKVGTLSPIDITESNNATEAIILVPGLNSIGLSEDLYEWRNFWDAWNESDIDENTRTKYKFVVFRYDGWDSLYNSAETLTQGIKELIDEEPNIKSLNIIGYSQGGIIPRIIFVNHPEIEEITNQVQTLAAPHHGTLTLTKKLTLDSIATQNPFVAVKNRKALELLSGRYIYAYKEQAWNDFDGAIPVSAKYTVPEEAQNLPTPKNVNKFITYASYIFPPRAISFEDKFGMFFGEVVPRMYWDRRAGMKELNRWMAKKIYIDEESKLRDNFRLNDGVTPLSSGLWVQLCDSKEKQPDNWKNIFPTNNYCPRVSLQRAFYGADHLLWREPIAARKKVRDMLHPELSKKSIYAWIIDDLLNNKTHYQK